MTGFAKRGLIHTIINIWKDIFEILNSSYLKNVQRCLYAFSTNLVIQAIQWMVSSMDN